MIVGNSAIEENMVHVYLHLSFVGKKKEEDNNDNHNNNHDNNKVYSLAN